LADNKKEARIMAVMVFFIFFSSAITDGYPRRDAGSNSVDRGRSHLSFFRERNLPDNIQSLPVGINVALSLKIKVLHSRPFN
jgi:hypothetical protein